jgi:hypothetical protein
VALAIVTPEGDERRVATDAAGRVRIPELAPGDCAVASAMAGARAETAYAPCAGPRAVAAARPRATAGPAHLVEITRHRIRRGETPASIARLHAVPWETIARFNWGTEDPAALETHYRDTLGCRHRRPDGRLRFDDGDEPGILLVPRPWEARLGVGPLHEVHVAPLRPLFLSLENEAGLPIPRAGYRVRFADGSERTGRLGASGIARLESVPEGPFTVTYPDELDLHARSLAVSARRALDEVATAPLFTLLMQAPDVVERAVAVYEAELNHLTGRGLVADLDQVITDPEARRPLRALGALAGLELESAGANPRALAG